MTKLSLLEKECDGYWTKIYLRGISIIKEKQKNNEKISPEIANFLAKKELDKKIMDNSKQLYLQLN